MPRQPLIYEDSGKKPSVVVVDDHLVVLETMVRLLRNECQILGTAQSGLRGIEVVVMTDPDLAILDISMPDLDGFEVAQRIRALQLRTKFVFITEMEDRDSSIAWLAGNTLTLTYFSLARRIPAMRQAPR